MQRVPREYLLYSIWSLVAWGTTEQHSNWVWALPVALPVVPSPKCWTLGLSPMAWWNICARPTLMNYNCLGGWKTHRNVDRHWVCWTHAWQSTRTGMDKAHARKCRARAHKGHAQAQHTRWQAPVLCLDKQASKPTNDTGGKYSCTKGACSSSILAKHQSCRCCDPVLSLVRLRHDLEHSLTCRIAQSGRHSNTNKSGCRIRLKHSGTRVRAAGKGKGCCF